MLPLSAKIRRSLPFSIPLLIALVLIGTVYRHSMEYQLSAGSTSVGGTPKTKVFSSSERKSDQLVTVAKRQRPEDPPRNPLVAGLIERFELSDRKMPEATIRELAQHPLGKKISLKAAGMELNGVIDSRRDSGGVVHVGVALDDKLGRFQISLREDDRILASVMFNGESHALEFHGFPVNGSWNMESTSVSGILCTPAGGVYPLAENEASLKENTDPTSPEQSAKSGPEFATIVLSSNPESSYVLYCDFDGESVTHPSWNNGVTIDAKPHARADDAAFVTKVWQRVSEDFAPFDLNVTTDRAAFDAADVSRRVHCVITPTSTAAPTAGGVAYLNSFGEDTPCWAFNASEDTCADTISHEAGHTLGLMHDGLTTGVEYYGGHGSGPTSWAPIMGAFFADGGDEELTQWSKGEYPEANNQEDDLTIITSENGFGYRDDDKGNTLETASILSFSEGDVVDSGIIERTDDQDWFAFSTSGGSVILNIKAVDVQSPDADQRGSNLAVSAELYDSAGVLVQSSNPASSLDASISFNITAGNYFLKVDGAGRGDLETGFSDYDSLGQYAISGSVPQNGLVTVSPASQDFTSKGGTFSFDVSSDVTWTWSSSEAWVTSTEATPQSGNQVFGYTVDPNPTEVARTAIITISVGSFTATHTINQEPLGGDDHGNDIYTATLVEQNSTTDGKIEEGKDVDVFRINLKGYGDLTVKATGTTDTYGELLDFSGHRIASNDSAAKPNFKITERVSRGTYYVRVRHALKYGVGSYKLVCSFKSKPELSISPKVRTVGENGGTFTFDVTSTEAWFWSCNSDWIDISETANQNGGQTFTYKISPNPTNESREGGIKIQLAGKDRNVVHLVTQQGTLTDDHADNIAHATPLAPNGNVNGNIQFGGDVDTFKIVLQKRGELTVQTFQALDDSKIVDTTGQLLDAEGKVIASNDDYSGKYFGILRSLNAGTYFVKVRHFNDKKGVGAYRLVSSFNPSALVDVVYKTSLGGSLQGDTRQTIPLGSNGTPVTAVPGRGYYFAKWSDGRTDAIRKDLKIKSNIRVTAKFERILSVKVAGGDELVSNEIPGVDYGTLLSGQSRKVTFVISNSSGKTLTNVKVSKTGADSSAWKVSSLERTRIESGESSKFSATFKASSTGNQSAILIVTADGAQSSFKIQVRARVESGPATGKLVVTTPPLNGSGKASSVISPAQSQLASPKGGTATQTAAAECWIAASPDGLFRYHYRRPVGDDTVPNFLLSSNGLDWNEAELISIQRLSRDQDWEQYEVTFSPPELGQPFILVSEIPTRAKNP